MEKQPTSQRIEAPKKDHAIRNSLLWLSALVATVMIWPAACTATFDAVWNKIEWIRQANMQGEKSRLLEEKIWYYEQRIGQLTNNLCDWATCNDPTWTIRTLQGKLDELLAERK